MGFPEEPLPILLFFSAGTQTGDGLDGDNTVYLWIAGSENSTHGAVAQHLQNLIATKLFHFPGTGGSNLSLLFPNGKNQGRRTDTEFRHVLKLTGFDLLVFYEGAVRASQIHQQGCGPVHFEVAVLA